MFPMSVFGIVNSLLRDKEIYQVVCLQALEGKGQYVTITFTTTWSLQLNFCYLRLL